MGFLFSEAFFSFKIIVGEGAFTLPNIASIWRSPNNQHMILITNDNYYNNITANYFKRIIALHIIAQCYEFAYL